MVVRTPACAVSVGWKGGHGVGSWQDVQQSISGLAAITYPSHFSNRTLRQGCTKTNKTLRLTLLAASCFRFTYSRLSGLQQGRERQVYVGMKYQPGRQGSRHLLPTSRTASPGARPISRASCSTSTASCCVHSMATFRPSKTMGAGRRGGGDAEGLA